MKKVLVDTSVLIDFLRRPKRRDSWYLNLAKQNQLVVSLITVAEIYSGRSAQTKAGKKVLEGILAGVEIRIPNLNIAMTAGAMRAKLDLSLADAFIASLGIVAKLPLASFNSKHFAKVVGLDLIAPSSAPESG